MNSDPVAGLVLALAVVLVAAKLVGHLAIRLGQPAVLGELVAGILLGNAHLAGLHLFDGLLADSMLDLLARFGVLLLLFEVGLESTIGQMLRVGPSALLVATTGVVATFVLGFAASSLLLPASPLLVRVFLGATLCATSVGISARVFQDLGATATTEARIVLGASVVDDVESLIVLAMVTGVASSMAAPMASTTAAGAHVSSGVHGFDVGAVLLAVGKAAGFLVGALAIGALLSRRLFLLAAKLQARGVLLATGLALCFVLAWAADAIGLAPIIGAFAAGLILEDAHSKPFVARGEASLDELVKPLTSTFAPVFFVLMGAKTNLASFAHLDVLLCALLLTVAAIGGKLVAGLVALKPKPLAGGEAVDSAAAEAPQDGRLRRTTIGFGLLPRGEVELIFANAGRSIVVDGAPIIDDSLFSAIVAVVVLTTLLTPPLLRFSLRKRATDQGS